MKVSRFTLDIIRVVAMIGVVTDHYLQMTRDNDLINTGLYMGGVSVALFFSLSAYLFGEKWRRADNKEFEVLPFLKKRFLRIYIPLWVSLFFIIALEWYVHHPLDVQTVAFNFLGLSWARPFTWAGHLWYITMIVILYVAFLLISRIRLDKIPLWLWLLSFIALSVMMICLPNLFNTVSKVTIPHTLFFAAMVFSVGDKMMNFCVEHKYLIGNFTLAFILGSWYLHLGGLFHSYTGIATVLNSTTGLLLFYAMASIIRSNGTAIIGWLSGISYELYLIHLTAIMFVRVLLPDYPPLMFYSLSLIVVLISSVLLHIVSEKISNVLTHK